MTGAVSRREVAALLACSPLLVAAARNSEQPRLPSSRQQERFWRSARKLGAHSAVVATADDILLAEGAETAPLRVASIRKSILSVLIGMAVDARKIDLSLTLRQLDIGKDDGLTALEQTATVRQLMQARSGIYIPSAQETPAMKARRPKRGSHRPGAFWYYNNWDFNVLGEIYQRTTGEDLFIAIERRLAGPLEWNDFRPLEHMRWAYDPEYPSYPAYQMSLSTRELARFGQMMLSGRDRAGRHVLSERWIAESTHPWSATGRAGWSRGYGYMWWTAADPKGRHLSGIPGDAFTAAGNGGRYLTVIPSRGLVIAVQPNEQPGGRAVPLYAQRGAYDRLLTDLLARD